MSEGQGRAFFVVGNSRSGTTMMSRILGAHPEVYAFEELHFFEQLWDPNSGGVSPLLAISRLLRIERAGFFDATPDADFAPQAHELLREAGIDPLDKNATLAAFRAFLEREAQRHGASIPCEQTPRNVFYIREILELLPGATVVNMVRDPRDVLLSQKNKWRRRKLGGKSIPRREALRSWVNYHPYLIGRLWASCVAAAQEYADDARVVSVRFEDVVAQPRAEVERICNAARLPFDERMLEVPQVGSSTRPDRPDALGIRSDAAGSWLKGGLSKSEVHIASAAAEPWLTNSGYPRSEVTGGRLARLASWLTLPPRVVAVLGLNLTRMRSATSAVRRRLKPGS